MPSSRPQHIDDTIKGNTLKSIQKKKLKEILDSTKDEWVESRMVKLREYLVSKNVPVKAILKETFMGKDRIAIHLTSVSYFFAV